MKFLKFFVPLVVIGLVSALLYQFRPVSSSHLWNGYTVLYIPESVSDNQVKEAFAYSEIIDYVCLSDQKNPVILADNSPEYSMFRIFYNNPEFEYMSRRLNYFYDKSGEFRLYYIPTEQESKLKSCVKFLQTQGCQAGIDMETTYPWILPAIVTLIAFLLMIYSRGKLIFIFSALVPVFYSFTNPYFPCVMAVILLLLVLFFVSSIWEREGAFKALAKNYIVILTVAVSAVSAFSASVASGNLFLAVLFTVVLSIYFYIYVHNTRISRKSFQFVLIRPARMISIFAGKTNLVMTSVIFSGILVLAYFGLTSSGRVNLNSQQITLPGNSEISEENLPELEDFYRWQWNIYSLPYRNLNFDTDFTDSIVYPGFIEENGVIVPANYVMNYDESFKKSALEMIDSLGFEPIEKVINQQSEDFQGGYITATAKSVSFFSIIMMFICFAMLLFIYFSVMISKGGRK